MSSDSESQEEIVALQEEQENDTGSLPKKRKVHRACDVCRRKKSASFSISFAVCLLEWLIMVLGYDRSQMYGLQRRVVFVIERSLVLNTVPSSCR